MFERYSLKARRVVHWAVYEVGQSPSTHIEPEHLLLGVLRERPDLSPDEPEIRKEIESQIGHNSMLPRYREVPLSDASKRVLKRAESEAHIRAHTLIGTEHILFAILQENSPASRLLLARGLSLPAPTEDRAD
jgi:ATP-dependent Clp protease ATP-binding subunit ClpC